MAIQPTTRYVIARSEQSIFTEIYFPKKAAYYGTIFDALRYGYEESKVKTYMHDHAKELLEQYRAYPSLFDPDDYTRKQRVTAPVSVAKARKRIRMYQSPFKGWSTYTVDGSFFDEHNKMYEEAVQVVRTMFRFKSSLVQEAEKAGCSDVLRSVVFWITSRQGRLPEHKVWFPSEKRLFLANQPLFPKRKRAFVEKHFTAIAKEVNKWIDDRGLFLFGYLVHQFAEQVLVEQLYEKEIWVTNLFDQNLIVSKRLGNDTIPITHK